VLRTVCDRLTLWEALLPPEALVMPAELGAVDRPLDDPRFSELLRRWFDPAWGRPSIPIETALPSTTRPLLLPRRHIGSAPSFAAAPTRPQTRVLAIAGEPADLAQTAVEQTKASSSTPNGLENGQCAGSNR